MADDPAQGKRKNYGARNQRQTVRKAPQNSFLLLELGIDLKDSQAFKVHMERRFFAKDLTPKLDGVRIALSSRVYGTNMAQHLEFKKKHPTGYSPTTFDTGRQYTYLSNFHPDGIGTRGFSSWFSNLIQMSPTILYISGHQGGWRSNGVFYNNLTFAFGFGDETQKHTIEFGEDQVLKFQNVSPYQSKSPSDHRQEASARKQFVSASNSKITRNLLAIIADGCNVCAKSHSGNSEGQEIQRKLRTASGAPVILSFGSKSPASGTASLHERFIKKLPSGVSLWNTFKKGTSKQDELVKFWMEAGKEWNRTAAGRGRDVWGITHDGKLMTQYRNGKIMP